MTRYLFCGVAIAALALVGCTDLSTPPEHVLEKQEQAVRDKPAQGPTELPPGLGADLPAPVSTQPAPAGQ